MVEMFLESRQLFFRKTGLVWTYCIRISIDVPMVHPEMLGSLIRLLDKNSFLCNIIARKNTHISIKKKKKLLIDWKIVMIMWKWCVNSQVGFWSSIFQPLNELTVIDWLARNYDYNY